VRCHNLNETVKRLEIQIKKLKEESAKVDSLQKNLDCVLHDNHELKLKLDVKIQQQKETDQKQIFYEEDLKLIEKENYRIQFQSKSLEKELDENRDIVKQYENRINEVSLIFLFKYILQK